MFIIQDFDPTAATSGTIKTNLGGCGKLYLFNESNTSLTLKYGTSTEGDVIGILPAWYARAFTITRPGSVIFWEQRNVLSFTGTNPWISKVPGASGQPQFLVQGEAYYQGEDTSNLYVGPLVRQSNIGNVVSTTGGVATSVQNDGNAAPLTVVESTAQGSSASSLFFENDGTVTIRDTSGNILFSITPATKDVRIPQGSLGIEALANVIATSGTDRRFISNGGDHVIQSPAGTETGRITNAGQYRHTLFGFATVSASGAAGTIQIWQPFSGTTFNVVIGSMSGFKGLAGSAINLALPIPFTTRSDFHFYNAPSVGMSFLSSGVAQTCSIQTGLGNATTAGTNAPGTVVRGFSQGAVRGIWDTLQIPAGDLNTTSDLFYFIGQ